MVNIVKIELNDEEYARIVRYLGRLEGLRQQIESLKRQGDEMVDVINTSWRSAYRRVQLEDPAVKNEDIPQMVDEQGNMVIELNPKDKTAEWASTHDVKRVAVPVPEVKINTEVREQSDEEEKSDERTECE